MMNITDLNIAGVDIELQTEIPIRMNDSFAPFLTDRKKHSMKPAECTGTYKAVYNSANGLILPEQNIVGQTRDFTVYEEKPGSYIRVYRNAGDGHPYAVSKFDRAARSVRVQYLPSAEKNFTEAGNTFFHIEWENLLIREKKMILHAACVSHAEAGGILFSGPSGAGKSTQAELWCRYEGARMINGDRTILGRGKAGWTAYGSPYAGSSKCYLNEGCRVTAVVFVEKAQKCGIRKMGYAETFQKIFGGLTINSWDKNFVNRVCDLTRELVFEIPVYEMLSTPNRQTVELLYNELRKG